MTFSDILKQLQPQAQGWTATVGDDWLQGRSVFGGLQAALGVRAMRERVPAGIPLRSLQTTFIAPLPAGTVRVQAVVLREGKSALHVQASLWDGDQLACLMVGIFGRSRESVIALELPPLRVEKTSAQAQELPFIPGVTPAFTRHIEFRWALGGFPYMGAAQAHTQIYVRMREEPQVGEAEVIALADAIPSPGLSLLKKPAAASSLTWTLELLRDDHERSATAPWLMDAQVSAARDGYLNQTATLWDPQGRAVALSRQTVVVFG